MEPHRGRAVLKMGLLAVALLFALSPGVAAAGTVSLAATGPVLTIDEGVPTPIAGSDRFFVVNRTVTGSLAGDWNGAFSFTFQANVDLLTQSGPIQGTLNVQDTTLLVADVKGFSRISLGPAVAIGVPSTVDPSTCPSPFPPPSPAIVIVLDVRSSFILRSGAAGNGSADAVVTAEINPCTGHIVSVVQTVDAPLLDPGTFEVLGYSETQLTITGRLR